MIINRLDESFIEKMKKLLGDKYNLYVNALEKNPVRGIRFNPIKIDKKLFENNFNYDIKPVAYEKNGYILNTEEKLGNSLLHLAGCFYIQEPSSMMPVACLDVQSDAKVLDLCASPGGKSTQVAVKIPYGLLVSNEIVTSRSKILFQNIERLGIQNSIILNDTPLSISEKLPNVFDVILVDAPCGGEGMFRKDPDTIKEWSQDRLLSNHQRQIEILECADKCLKSNGKIIYSTCTFDEIENENVILEFLENHDYIVLQVPSSVKECTDSGTKVPLARRFYPFTGNGEGQFVCVLEKQGECSDFADIQKNFKPVEISKKDNILVREFIDNNFNIPFDYELIMMHNNIMLVFGDMIKLIKSGVNVVNAGVRVGSIEKGVLKPHHQLFSALGVYSKFKYELSENEAKKYVHGEELGIENGHSAYYTVTYLGAALGGAKCVQNRLKNLYPKGLRI